MTTIRASEIMKKLFNINKDYRSIETEVNLHNDFFNSHIYDINNSQDS